MSKPFWVSWWHFEGLGEFELHSPWWVSGYSSEDETSICAAVRADDEIAAKQIIVAAYDVPPSGLAFRFCEPRQQDWTPFCDRFSQADWMVWGNQP